MFQKQKLIRFHHCDPFGIVFYPQYFMLIHEFCEDWYYEGLGLDYGDFVNNQGLGFPLAHIDVDFKAPSRTGERVDMQLTVERVGNSSMQLTIDIVGGGQLRLRARLSLVQVSNETMRGVPFNEEMRNQLQRYMRAEA